LAFRHLRMDVGARTVIADVHLGHIRQKVGRDDLIVTIRGIGYRFEDESL